MPRNYKTLAILQEVMLWEAKKVTKKLWVCLFEEPTAATGTLKRESESQ